MSAPKRKKQPDKSKKARGTITLGDLKVRKETLMQLSGGEAAEVKGGLRKAEGTCGTTCRASTCSGGTDIMPC